MLKKQSSSSPLKKKASTRGKVESKFFLLLQISLGSRNYLQLLPNHLMLLRTRMRVQQKNTKSNRAIWTLDLTTWWKGWIDDKRHSLSFVCACVVVTVCVCVCVCVCVLCLWTDISVKRFFKSYLDSDSSNSRSIEHSYLSCKHVDLKAWGLCFFDDLLLFNNSV